MDTTTMTPNDTDHDEPNGKEIDRRRLLAGVGGALAAGLAGCSGVTEQSFAASTVALPESSREELWLAETARDSRTISRSGPADSEVEITNRATVYNRAAWLEGE